MLRIRPSRRSAASCAALLAGGIVAVWPGGALVRAADCVPAGTTGMTAKVVLSAGEMFMDSVDATGCDIGIYIGPNADFATVHNATVSGANDHGILVQDNVGVTVLDSVVTGNGVAKHAGLSEDKALTLLGTQDAVVQNTSVVDNVGDGGISINDDGFLHQSTLNPGALHSAEDNLLLDNLVSGNLNGCAIVLSAWNTGAGVRHNMVKGNVVTGRPGVFPPVIGSIVVAADPPNTVASDNWVLGNTVTGSFIPGLIVHSNAPGDAANGNKLVGNTVVGDDWGKVDGPNAHVGIAIAAEAPTAVLDGTVVAGNRIASEDIGIWLHAATNTHIGGFGLNSATEPVGE